MKERWRVLILCTGNSARSQMAEGLLRHDGGDQFEVESAGVSPGSVRPEAIEVMGEIGIDITGHRSKSVEEFIGQRFDYLITVCDNARETCPVFPGDAERIHQSFEDPRHPVPLLLPKRLPAFAAFGMRYVNGWATLLRPTAADTLFL